jgi:HSP20 family protein
MLMRFDPFRELDRVGQLLGQPGEPRAHTIPMDAYRQGDQLVVNFDIPGVDPEAIDLTVERNVVTLRVERRWQPAEGQEVLINERPQGTFTRELLLGDNLDPENVEASYDNGVLTLMIPVAEQSRPRKVMVAGHEHEQQEVTAQSREQQQQQVSAQAQSQQPASSGT